MQSVFSAFSGRNTPVETAGLVIHAQGDLLKSIQGEKIDFFVKMIRKATRQGMTTRIVEAEGSTARMLLAQDHLHIIAADIPGYGPGQMHAMPSYIWGFWYFDEVGAYWNSSLRFARFCPDEIDAEKAAYFFNGVSGHMLRENVSRHPQETRMKTPMKSAAAVVVCQDIEGRPNRSHFLTTDQMIRTTASACRDRPVYVKPHPHMAKADKKAVIDIANDYQNVTVSDASIHDLIEASEMVVTQNSAAGFEALMQKRCVITCAKSDYWHATLTPKTEADLREALTFGAEAMADFPYEKYFYWFLERNCLEPAKDEFENRLWSRIKDKLFL